jgi:hypothetical protein
VQIHPAALPLHLIDLTLAVILTPGLKGQPLGVENGLRCQPHPLILASRRPGLTRRHGGGGARLMVASWLLAQRAQTPEGCTSEREGRPGVASISPACATAPFGSRKWSITYRRPATAPAVRRAVSRLRPGGLLHREGHGLFHAHGPAPLEGQLRGILRQVGPGFGLRVPGEDHEEGGKRPAAGPLAEGLRGAG